MATLRRAMQPIFRSFMKSTSIHTSTFTGPAGSRRSWLAPRAKRRESTAATPREGFQGLPEAARYLKPGQNMEALQKLADAESDTDNARRMQDAKRKLFHGFETEKRRA